jgi:energy-coupling factor transporter ATP-binding protein EcfA2
MAEDAFDIQLGLRRVVYAYGSSATSIPYVPFGIRRADLRSHLYVVGKTGCGKSTLIKSIVSQAIAQGIGVAVLDPHGTLIEDILDEAIPGERIKDTIVFAPGDRDWPVSLNLLRCAKQPSQVASGLVDAFEGLFGYSWGPRLEYILFCSIASLASARNTSLLGMERILVDRSYRERILRQVTDPIVLHFWRAEFDAWSEKYRTEAIESIQNKVGQLFASPELRNVLGQVSGRIDVRTIMDTPGSIFLANLSKGAVGDDKANLIGSFLVSLFRIAAMQREDTPEEERRDFLLVADEFQNFVTSSFATALSEVRKYRLNLLLANQYRKQVREDIRDAVFGNVGSIISFRVGSDDAALLEEVFAPSVSANQLLNLGRYEIYARIQEDSLPGVPFEGKTLRPELGMYGQRKAIINASRACYAQPRAKVEAKIARFLPRKSPP